MSFKAIKVFFWITFGLTILILPLNFGIGLIGLGLIILPMLVLHLTVGTRLTKIEGHRTSIILSALNLITFALVRPDGVHASTDTGLSAALDIVGVNAGYSDTYENHFLIASLVLMLVQIIMDMRLRTLARQADKTLLS